MKRQRDSLGLSKVKDMLDGAEDERQRKRSASQELANGSPSLSRAAFIDPVDMSAQSSGSSLRLDDLSRMSVDNPSDRPSAGQQLDQIRPLLKQKMTLGQTWYILPRNWYSKWVTACSLESGQTDENADEKAFGHLTCRDLGPVDFSPLLDTRINVLLKAPIEGVDAVFLPSDAYLLFVKWYGIQGPPPIARKVVPSGASTESKLEFYVPSFAVQSIIPANAFARAGPTISLSSGETLGTLRKQIKAGLGLPDDAEIRMYRIPSEFSDGTNGVKAIHADAVKAEDMELTGQEGDQVTLAAASLDEVDMQLAIDHKTASRDWLVEQSPAEPLPGYPASLSSTDFNMRNKPWIETYRPTPALGPMNGSTNGPTNGLPPPPPLPVNSLQPRYGASERFNLGGTSRPTGLLARTSRKTIGVTGLSNLGNTCFMNSALQCLSNAVELRKYFQSSEWRNEINKDNPLGMSGAVAEAFGELIAAIWSGRDSFYTPKAFKQMIGRFRPMFIGWAQQDSQELLSFLLDGLHEDLNRIVKKPPTVKPEWEGGGDLAMWKMAEESWRLFKLRNDSVIVDLFQGMYRSTVVCPDCAKVSITFDAYTSLTLPIPTKPWKGTVFVYPLDTNKPRYRINLTFVDDTSIFQVKTMLGQKLGMDAAKLYAVEIWHNKVYKRLSDDAPVSDYKIKPDSRGLPIDSLYFYELAFPCPQPTIHSLKQSKQKPPAQINDELERVSVFVQPRSKGKKVVALPFIICLTFEEASDYKQIHLAVLRQLARLSRRGADLFKDAAEIPVNGSSDDAQTHPTSIEKALADDVDDMMMSSKPSVPVNSRVPPQIPGTATPRQELCLKVTVPNNRQADIHNTDCENMRNVINLTATLASNGDNPSVLPGSFPNGDASGDAEVDNMYDNDQPNGTEEMSRAPAPLVRTGDYIFCELSDAYIEYFSSQAMRLDEDKTAEFQEEPGEEETAVAPELSVDACLNEFSRQEQLDAQNTWFCPVCKEHKEATKQVDLYSLPDTIVMHLKRFSASRYGSRDKLADFVDFPLEGLDLTNRVIRCNLAKSLLEQGVEMSTLKEYADEKFVYDLFAVDNHFGGLGGGHYTAYAQNSEDGMWYSFDDSHTSPINTPTKDVQTPAAYLLFYRRRGAQLAAGKTAEIILTSATASPHVKDIDIDDVVDARLQQDTAGGFMMPSYRSGAPSIDSGTSAASPPLSTTDNASDEADPGDDNAFDLMDDPNWSPIRVDWSGQLTGDINLFRDEDDNYSSCDPPPPSL